MRTKEEITAWLKTLQDNRFETRAFIYLDIISWLESKLENIPVQEIMKRKFSEKRKGHSSAPPFPPDTIALAEG